MSSYQRISGKGIVASSSYVSGAGVISGPLTAPNGTAAAPSYSFVGAPDTGMYSPGAGQLAFSSAGVQCLSFSAVQAATFAAGLSATSGTFTGVVTVPSGSAGAPGLTIAGSASTGVYSAAANELDLTANGQLAVQVKKDTGAFPILGIGTAPVSTQTITIKGQTNDSSAYALSVLGSTGGILFRVRNDGQCLANTANGFVTGFNGSNGNPAFSVNGNGGIYSPGGVGIALASNGANTFSVDNSQNVTWSQGTQVGFRRMISSKTGTYTVTTADSGTCFITGGATTFTLPATSVGLTYTFINGSGGATDLVVKCTGGTDKIGLDNATTTASTGAITSVSSNKTVTLVCFVSGFWSQTSNTKATTDFTVT